MVGSLHALSASIASTQSRMLHAAAAAHYHLYQFHSYPLTDTVSLVLITALVEAS